MKLVIVTQFRENYGAHNWDGFGDCPQGWKNKGGEIFVMDISLDELNSIDFEEPAVIRELIPLIEYATDYSTEDVIDWHFADDHDEIGMEWEVPFVITRQNDGSFLCTRYTRAELHWTGNWEGMETTYTMGNAGEHINPTCVYIEAGEVA
tara:strand:- start:242 stop:691 length:450 start_codon:yes stop_codon:yes gene_type:complete